MALVDKGCGSEIAEHHPSIGITQEIVHFYIPVDDDGRPAGANLNFLSSVVPQRVDWILPAVPYHGLRAIEVVLMKAQPQTRAPW